MAPALAKDSLFTLISNVALAASNWLVLILITKHYSVDLLGGFVLALSLFSPAFLLASFKVRTLLIVDKDWHFSVENYATARLLANIIGVVVIFIVAHLVFPAIPLAVLVLVAVYKYADAWCEFCQSYLRRERHFPLIAASTTARAVITIVMLMGAAYTEVSLNIVLLIWAAATCVFAGVDTYWFLARWNEPLRNRFSFSQVITFGSVKQALKIYQQYLTVAVALLIGALFVHAPNYFLGHFESATEVGIFAAISYFLFAGGILINSLSQAATPALVNKLASNDKSGFQRIIVYLCMLGVCIGIVGVGLSYLIGEWILTVFYNQEIAAHWLVLVWVMLAAAIRYLFIFLGTGLAAMQRFHVQTKIALLGFSVLCVALYLWIPAHGLLGSAYAMVVSTATECVAYLLVFTHQTDKVFKVQQNNDIVKGQ